MNTLLCETCGNAIAADAPSGLCPVCLLRSAIEHGSSRAIAPFLPKLRYFGDYELLEEIARGGMGVVYRAKQVSLDRIVALKMMRPGLLSTEPEIRRFLSEAQTAASLRHPNIVAIHEAGEFDGLHYFSMDFVEGPNLAEVVKGGALSPVEAARYVQILAETVHYAHTRGILHRDLKPSNVLVDAAGRPLITDFGVARRMDGDGTLTGTGSVVGTPAYMPPEQASGQSIGITAASDVYSLGAILYELLTGQPPFRAGTQLETVRMVVETEPRRPRLVNPAVDNRIEAICLRCLAKKPADRFGSAAELAEDLKRFLAGEPVQARVREKRLRWAGIAAACVIAILATWSMLRNKSPRYGEPPHHAETVPVSKPPETIAEIPSPKPSPRKPEPKAVARPIFPAKPVPVDASVSPASGTGYAQVFSFRYPAIAEADSTGKFEISFRDETRACNIFIEPGRVQIQFNPAGGPGLRVSGIPGSLGRIENSICGIDLSGVMVAAGANGTELRLPMTFQPAFDGAKTVESRVWRKQGVTASETTLTGKWTVGPQR